MDASRLQADARTLGVHLDDGQAGRLIRYVALLERWNARFNLISRRDIGRIWPRHILDSLSIAVLLTSDQPEPATVRAFDIGTGAGLPGLPLAIARPELSWLLIDRNHRKIRFLETVIGELGLTNAAARVADLGGRTPDDLRAGADIVVSRAVDDPASLMRLAEPLLNPGGRLVLMTATGVGPQDDEDDDAFEGKASARPMRVRTEPGRGFKAATVHELSIPGLDRTHEVTIIEREQCDPGLNRETEQAAE